MDMLVVAGAIFLLAYVLIVFFYGRRNLIVWVSVLLLLLIRVLTPAQALGSINVNVILLYTGMMFVSGVFLYSKMPDYFATLLASKAKTVPIAMLVICAFTGFISIFLDNVTTVLLVAPIALSIARKCEINPVQMFIGMAVSSNLQGCATLIGDPPSMLLAGYAKMNFNDFFFLNGRPGIFFAVQLGAIMSLLVLYFFFRKYNKKMPELGKEKYVSIIPSLVILLLIASMALSSSLQHGISYMNGLLCLIFGLLCFSWYLHHTKAGEIHDFVSNLDWRTGAFLIGVFILVESLTVSGIVNYIAQLILGIGGSNTFLMYMAVVLVSVALSAFIDNIPFLVAMLPVTQIITNNLGIDPHLFYFGLLLGTSVGGNITPIGASANIVAMGIVKKQGYEPKFMDFVKIGLPFTVVSVLVGSMFIWIMFS